MSPAVSQPRRARERRQPDRRPPVKRSHVQLESSRIPARATTWPGEPDVAQLIVLDAGLVPTARDFLRWGELLAERGYLRMRTGALGSRQSLQAEAAGMTCIQELTLLEARPPLQLGSGRPRPRTARLRDHHLAEIADIDHAAFGDRWRLDAGMLADVRRATPSFRARVVRTRHLDVRRAQGADRDGHGTLAGFLVSGRAGRTGYVQRLAVDPRWHRQGIGAALLTDSLRWMQRWRADRVLVNTHVDNEPALALYRRAGFVDLPELLRVHEARLDAERG